MARTWTTSDPRWAALNPYQRAALMALMEADRADPAMARNALGAMINRSARERVDLGEHVSRPIYQPTIEPAQQARLDRLLKHPEFSNLTQWAERRAQGLEEDPVGGATHFLAHPKTMLNLSGGVRQAGTDKNGNPIYVGNSSKYYSWPKWTGYNPQSGQYRNQVHTDAGHAFLAPEGGFSVAYKGQSGATPATAVADASGRVAPSSPAGDPLGPAGVVAGNTPAAPGANPTTPHASPIIAHSSTPPAAPRPVQVAPPPSTLASAGAGVEARPGGTSMAEALKAIFATPEDSKGGQSPFTSFMASFTKANEADDRARAAAAESLQQQAAQTAQGLQNLQARQAQGAQALTQLAGGSVLGSRLFNDPQQQQFGAFGSA